MVDDPQDRIGTSATGSNGAPSPQPPNNSPPPTRDTSKDIAEARIVDEVIIKPPAGQSPLGGASPPLPPPPKPAVPSSPVPAAPKANLAPPPTANIAVDSLDEKLIVPPPVPPPRKSIEETVAPAPIKSSAENTPPTIRTPATPLTGDIEKILKEVKLPERSVVPNEPKLPKEQATFDTTLASPLTPPQKESESITQPSPPSPPGNAEEKKRPSAEHPSSIVAPVHTLKNDFQDIVREKKISLVRAAALEQDKQRDLDKRYDLRDSEKKRRSFGIVFASILLALLGTAAFFGVAIVMQERGGVPAGQEETSLLFAEAALPLPMENLTAFDIKRLLSQARLDSNTTLGSITRIVPTVRETSPEGASLERPATLEEFLRAIEARASPELLRALGSEFFFGLHTVDENAPLLIVPVTSYERAFAGMLAWEKMLNADVAPVFTPVPGTIVGEDGLLAERQFEDIVMRNYDVRVLMDNADTIQLYYSFPTRELLIIAESPYSFAEILARLRAERKL